MLKSLLKIILVIITSQLFSLLFLLFPSATLAAGLGQTCSLNILCDSGLVCRQYGTSTVGGPSPYVCMPTQLATPTPATTAPTSGKAFTPQVGIGDDFQVGQAKSLDGSTSMIAQYIRAIYKYAIGIIGILAAVVLMVGGVMWIVAGGNASAIGEAKAWIGASLTGLLLALMSYLILATINPALIDLRISQIKTVTPVNSTNTLNPLVTCCNGSVVSCPQNYVCITAVPYAQLSQCPIANPQGICFPGTGAGGIQENQICTGQADQCAIGLHCSTADNRCRTVDWENPGKNNDSCGASSLEGYKCKTAVTVLAVPTCGTGYTHFGTGGRSCGSGLMCCKQD